MFPSIKFRALGFAQEWDSMVLRLHRFPLQGKEDERTWTAFYFIKMSIWHECREKFPLSAKLLSHPLRKVQNTSQYKHSLSLTFLSSEVIFSKFIEVSTQPTGLIIVLFLKEYLNIPTDINLHHKTIITAGYFIITHLLLYKYAIGSKRYGNPVMKNKNFSEWH